MSGKKYIKKNVFNLYLIERGVINNQSTQTKS